MLEDILGPWEDIAELMVKIASNIHPYYSNDLNPLDMLKLTSMLYKALENEFKTMPSMFII